MKPYIFNTRREYDYTAVPAKFIMCIYILFLLIISCTSGIVISVLNVGFAYGLTNTEPIKLYSQENNKQGFIETPLTSDLKTTAKYYPVQINSARADTGDNTPQSSNINSSEPSTEKVTEISNDSRTSSDANQQANSNPKTTIKCQGTALCVIGELVKVVNGKTFYVYIQNKVYKVELSLIDLPIQNEQAMRAATIFTRNTCLGSNVLIDQDDGQRVGSFVAQVYCSPTKNLNALLLATGYVQIDKSQCPISEFSKLSWAHSHGC